MGKFSIFQSCKSEDFQKQKIHTSLAIAKTGARRLKPWGDKLLLLKGVKEFGDNSKEIMSEISGQVADFLSNQGIENFWNSLSSPKTPSATNPVYGTPRQ